MKDMNSKWLASSNDLSISRGGLSVEYDDGVRRRRNPHEKSETARRKGHNETNCAILHVTPTRT